LLLATAFPANAFAKHDIRLLSSPSRQIQAVAAPAKPVATTKVVAKPVATTKVVAKPVATTKVVAKPAVTTKVVAKPAATTKIVVKPAATTKPVVKQVKRAGTAEIKQSGAKRVMQADKLAVLVKEIAKKHKIAMLHFTKAEKLGQVLLARIQKFQLWVQKGINRQISIANK